MMASRAMNGKGTVTACESYLPMLKLMKKVMRLNGMEGKIKVFNKRSDELEVGIDISSRADVLVSHIAFIGHVLINNLIKCL
jgi:protein arginine N-methyltransferase 7